MLHLDHIGISTRDADCLVRLLNRLTSGIPSSAEEVAGEGVRVQFYPAGSVQLELLEATAVDSPLGRHIARRGEGLHHIAFTVADIDAQMDKMRAAGFTPLSDAPRTGARNKRIFFLHPKQTESILIEFCQPASQWAITAMGLSTTLVDALLQTGRCILSRGEPHGHVVAGCDAAGDALALATAGQCTSLALYNAVCMSFADITCPLFIGTTQDMATDAIALRALWPQASLAVVPVGTPEHVLANLLTAFWDRIDD